MSIIIAAISMCCPIAGFFLVIAYFSTYRRAGISALLSGWAWGWALYGYIADSGNDIYRHMEHLALYKQVPFWQCFDILKNSKMTYLYTWDIWSWLISRLSNPYLLQFSAAFIGYGIITYIVFDYSNKCNLFRLKEWVPLLFIAICIFSPLGIAIGIRSTNSMLICGLGMYLVLVKGKKYYVSIIYMLIGIFLHHACVLILICWILSPLFKKHKIIFSVIMAFVLFSYTNYGYYLNVLSNSNFLMSDLLADTMRSANDYKNWTNTSLHYVFSAFWSVLCSLTMLIRPIYATQKKYDNSEVFKNEDILPGWNEELLFFELSCILMLILGTNGNRYLVISRFIGIVPLANSVSRKAFLSKGFFLLDLSVFFSALGMILLSLYDMSWGSGSAISLFYSLLIGVLSRI